MTNKPTIEPATDETIASKTQKKQAVHRLQALGEQLVALPPDRLRAIDMPEELLSAVLEARKPMKHEAKRRQMQFIGKLMREADPEPIQKAVDNLRHGDHHKGFLSKKIEGWAEALKAGDRQAIEDILASFPTADRQRLTQLARNLQAAGSDKAIHAAALLTRYLKEITDL